MPWRAVAAAGVHGVRARSALDIVSVASPPSDGDVLIEERGSRMSLMGDGSCERHSMKMRSSQRSLRPRSLEISASPVTGVLRSFAREWSRVIRGRSNRDHSQCRA